MTPRTAAVALPLPTPRPYHYSIPTALADRVTRGARVVVPVRGREMVGVVLETDPDAGDGLKDILLAPDPGPLVPGALLALARWIARYWAAPEGITLRAMLPGALWGSSRLVAAVRDPDAVPGGSGREVFDALERAGGRAPAAALTRTLRRPVWDTLQRLERAGAVTLETEPPDLGPAAGAERVLVLSESLTSLTARDEAFGRAAKQRTLYDALDARGGEAALPYVTRTLGFSRAVVQGLIDRGLARLEERERLRDPFAGVGAAPPGTPTEPQRAAVEALAQLDAGDAGLLFGVTGSGKTRVYLDVVRRTVDAGGGAVVLVPEIALTPQTVARVRGVFGDTVAVLHSALSDAERADAWRAAASGVRRVVVGARSAVFAPVRDLGVIVVDEEHDASYKNGEAPRYHARQVAAARARLEGARLVLATATPSLETWAARERIRVVELPERIGARPLPPVRLVDLRASEWVPDTGAVPWSRELDRAVEARLTAGEQVLLLLNRRGFAHFIQCPHCGLVPACPDCSIALTVHRTPARLRCHYCGHDEPVPPRCRACGHETQRTRGVGTQALEQWLTRRFGAARMARMDADTTATKWSHGKILDAVERHEVDLLFGTQMIAKGLDFPGVTLVGVVDADTGLHLPDFRAAERTFQLIAQVAGRAGRGPRGGEVLVQTRTPEHYALRAAAAHDYRAFAAEELGVREAPTYPPHVALANVLVSGEAEREVADAAAEVADWVRGLVQTRAKGRVEVLGPAPAPLARLKKRWRWHLLLRARDPRWLGRVARYVSRKAPHAGRGPVRLVVDRDPVSLL